MKHEITFVVALAYKYIDITVRGHSFGLRTNLSLPAPGPQVALLLQSVYITSRHVEHLRSILHSRSLDTPTRPHSSPAM